jgi:hypothetical protein
MSLFSFLVMPIWGVGVVGIVGVVVAAVPDVVVVVPAVMAVAIAGVDVDGDEAYWWGWRGAGDGYDTAGDQQGGGAGGETPEL